jgi:hypothetical protein
MIKRMIRKAMFGIACALCLTVYCECDDNDDHHHHDDHDNVRYSSLRPDEQHKENEVLLSSENLPAFALIRDGNDAL